MQMFECIMSDPESGETSVVWAQAEYLEDAKYVFELVTEPGQLWEGFVPFVPSTLSV